jgi:hypothetical protein
MSGRLAAAEGQEGTDDFSSMDDAQIEGLARHLGWKPMDEGFKGKPENFRDPRAFVETANRNPAVLWKNLTTLEKRYGTLERTTQQTQAKLGEAVNLIADMSDQFRTVQQRSYERARADLLAQREAAVEGGDKQGFVKADGALQELDKTKPVARAAPATPQPAQGQPPQEVQEWGQRNPWFYSDPQLQGEANALHVTLLNTRKDLSLADNLTTVERTIKAMYPAKFPKAPRQQAPVEDVDDQDEAPASERGNSFPRTPSRQSKRDFKSMPNESKLAFVRYKDMLGRKEGAKPLTEAEWATNYYDQFPEEA